mmetsp:Transcript_4026/g.9058  ORF Transcript_4026/g.9058 Transcript_4026/m.9058 type:complete len:623 (-) Transcript_4026:247-2115(-)
MEVLAFNWGCIVESFLSEFEKTFSTSKKAHFDCISNPKLRVVDGARMRWANMILMDAILYLLDFNEFNAASRRAFNQQQVLHGCIVSEMKRCNPRFGCVELSGLVVPAEHIEIALHNQVFPWASTDRLKAHILSDPTSKSKGKFLSIAECLFNHCTFHRYGLSLENVIKALLLKISTDILSGESCNVVAIKTPEGDASHSGHSVSSSMGVTTLGDSTRHSADSGMLDNYPSASTWRRGGIAALDYSCDSPLPLFDFSHDVRGTAGGLNSLQTSRDFTAYRTAANGAPLARMPAHDTDSSANDDVDKPYAATLGASHRDYNFDAVFDAVFDDDSEAEVAPGFIHDDHELEAQFMLDTHRWEFLNECIWEGQYDRSRAPQQTKHNSPRSSHPLPGMQGRAADFQSVDSAASSTSSAGHVHAPVLRAATVPLGAGNVGAPFPDRSETDSEGLMKKSIYSRRTGFTVLSPADSRASPANSEDPTPTNTPCAPTLTRDMISSSDSSDSSDSDSADNAAGPEGSNHPRFSQFRPKPIEVCAADPHSMSPPVSTLTKKRSHSDVLAARDAESTPLSPTPASLAKKRTVKDPISPLTKGQPGRAGDNLDSAGGIAFDAGIAFDTSSEGKY